MQTVTVAADEDDDTANDSATLTHTASGGDYGSVSGTVTVNTTDTSTRGLTFDPATVTVDEGDSSSYTVVLDTEPTGTVTVAISGHTSTDLTLGANSLTFTTSNWDTVQTVTVAADEDDDTANDSATLTHTASGGDYGSVSGTVTVNTTDTSTRGLTFDPATVTVDEGDSSSYTVALLTQPTAQVTVAITGQAGTDLTLGASSLTFTTANWDTAQTVTVAADEDDDAENDGATLAHDASGGDYGSVSGTVTVTTTDDDSVGLDISTNTVTVNEGSNSSYTVALLTQPTAQVTVAITGHAGTELTLGASSLTFTTSNWDTAQTVTVAAGEDDDAENDSATLAHDASGGDYGSVSGTVTVTTTDDDSVGLDISTNTVTVNEGSNSSYTVALLTQPTAQVTVAITGHAGTELTLGASSLTFTTSNWDTAQTVTVAAGEDDDAENDSATLDHNASGGDYGSVSGTVTVTTTDDDSVGLDISTNTVTVNEGSNSSYTVALLTQPTAQVTVAITGHAGTELTLGASSLTFTTSNWDTAQTVTVAAGEDDDADNDSATLDHNASGGDYGSVSGTVTVTTTDNDTRGLTLDPTSLGITEGNSGSYTVALKTQPTSTVTVAITGDASTDLTLSSKSLTFTTSNWSTLQTVTVTAGEDDNTANESATLAHNASGGDYGSVSGTVTVTTTDNDSVGLVFNPTAVTVNEGSSSSYTVRLATEPTGTVTVAITGDSGTELTLGATSLTFTTSNWNAVQTVTVAAGEDDDSANDSATLTHNASNGGYGSVSGTVAVNTTDNDTAALVLSPTELTVNEGGSGSYTVRLATEPANTVTVAITGHAGTDLTPSSTSLTFTTANWKTVQTVTVEAGQDEDAANDSETLTHNASDGGYGSVSGTVTVTVTDDETAALVLNPGTVTVNEGESGSYTVALATEPTNTVTVAITGHAGTDLTLTPSASLTFTTSNWNAPQTVTVAAGEDGDSANDSDTLAHNASGGGYGSVSGNVTVNTTDNDTAGLVLNPTTVTVSEGGSGSYTVALETQPTSTVTVAITGQAGTDLTLTPSASLTFTTSNWNAPQTVTVAAGEDDDTANDSDTLTHNASGGGYGSVSGNVAVTTTDNDTAGLVLNPTTVTVSEGGSGSYTVKLATEPTGTVTVAITGQADTDLTLTPASASLTFSTSNWNTLQTVTVAAGQDEDAANDSDTLTHNASGGGYGSVSGTVTVNTTDDDTAPTGITLTASPDSVAEGGGGQTISVTATIDGSIRFTEAKTVAVSVSDGTATSPDDYAAVSSFSITINAGDASASQTFTLTPADDAAHESTETINVTGTSTGLTVTGDEISITDDDTAPPPPPRPRASPSRRARTR